MTAPLRTYPRRAAVTRRFTLGLPRSFRSVVTPDGPVVFFVRSPHGDDPMNQLVMFDPETGTETVIVDPARLAVDDQEITEAERAQRERLREQAGGVTAYDLDRSANHLVFTLGGELFTTSAPFRDVQPRGVAGAFDARIAPDGAHVAFHSDGDVNVLSYADGAVTTVCRSTDAADYGRAEFIAAEEMGRTRGFWWLDDSQTLLVARVDETSVARWHISDPARPDRPSREVRYPAAGTPNADVTLVLVDINSGAHTPVVTDDAYPYIARVRTSAHGALLLCQSRDQRRAAVFAVDPQQGDTTLLRRIETSPWIELIHGTPHWDGTSVVTVEDVPVPDGQHVRAVCVDGEPITPPHLYVRDVVAVTDTDVTVHASGADPTVIAPYVVARDGSGEAARVAFPYTVEDGVHRLVAPEHEGAWWVQVHTDMTSVTPAYVATQARDNPVATRSITVCADTPGFLPQVTFLQLGERKLTAALILPEHTDDTQDLPVLLDPYGGPHAQRVLRHAGMYLSSAWFAAQGFAVLIIDGRGTPGRNPLFEHAIAGNFALTLEDQIDGLHAAKAYEPRLDLTRVAIRGWSFGGYLAALAVLRRPDVFRAAVAGAPVTHWQWYDTHYTERYLGTPDANPEAYAQSNLLTSDMTLAQAAPWDPQHPPELLLIHGLADDNVVAAHTLAFSAALLADNRPHQVLPLSGVTHMTPQEQVAEALLLQQSRFLQRAVGKA